MIALGVAAWGSEGEAVRVSEDRFAEVVRAVVSATQVPIAFEGAYELGGCALELAPDADRDTVAAALVAACPLAGYTVAPRGDVLEVRRDGAPTPLDAVVPLPPGRRELDALVAELRVLVGALPGVNAVGANYQGAWTAVVPEGPPRPLRDLLAGITLERVGPPPPTAGPGGTLVWTRAAVGGADGALGLRVVVDRPLPPDAVAEAPAPVEVARPAPVEVARPAPVEVARPAPVEVAPAPVAVERPPEPAPTGAKKPKKPKKPKK